MQNGMRYRYMGEGVMQIQYTEIYNICEFIYSLHRAGSHRAHITCSPYVESINTTAPRTHCELRTQAKLLKNVKLKMFSFFSVRLPICIFRTWTWISSSSSSRSERVRKYSFILISCVAVIVVVYGTLALRKFWFMHFNMSDNIEDSTRPRLLTK